MSGGCAGGGVGSGGEQVSLRRRLLGRNAVRVGCSQEIDLNEETRPHPLTETVFLSKGAAAEATEPDTIHSGNRLSSSSSVVLPTVGHAPLPPRPRSMLDSPQRGSPLNKHVDALRRHHQLGITKAHSDPNCDKQPFTTATVHNRDDRMSVSISEMQHIADKRINGHRPSSVASFENGSYSLHDRYHFLLKLSDLFLSVV